MDDKQKHWKSAFEITIWEKLFQWNLLNTENAALTRAPWMHHSNEKENNALRV